MIFVITLKIFIGIALSLRHHYIFTKNILVHAALNGTLKNSYIIFVVHKSLSYQKAAEVNKPSTFLYKIVPIWYRKELGDKYYTKRESILKELGVPLETFLKLETYEEFRNIAPFLKKSALSHLSDSLKTLSIDFTKKDVESLLSDVA